MLKDLLVVQSFVTRDTSLLVLHKAWKETPAPLCSHPQTNAVIVRVWVFVFRTVSYSVTQAGLELTI